jgi:hypothetical protein
MSRLQLIRERIAEALRADVLTADNDATLKTRNSDAVLEADWLNDWDDADLTTGCFAVEV